MSIQTPLVVDDREKNLFRVHRSAFTSEEILERERALIFDQSWVYVGHESEIPKPNNFLTRRVAGRTVIFNRDRSGTVRVMLNTCRHRGAEVCREERGSSRVFTCFYHGWAFDNSGSLVSVPDGDAYSSGFDRSKLGLHQPRTESYRGFVFVTFGADTPPLVEYLADARYLIDVVADQSANGMEIIAGTHNYSMRANWKLLMENSVDGYHALTVHQTYFEMMMNLGTTPPVSDAERAVTRGVDLGNGHGVAIMYDLGAPLMSPEVLEETVKRRTAMVERCGEARTQMMTSTTRNMGIFPNFVIVDLNFGIQIRTMYPLAPGHTEITGWQLMPSDDSDAVRRYRVDNALSFWGPAGLATPDDVEGLEQCQRGFATVKEVEWSDISRGMGRATPTIIDELQIRSFWREWDRRITGTVHETEGESFAESYPSVVDDLTAASTGA